MPNIGDRVGAIAGSNEQGVDFFGYGTYLGDRQPTSDVNFMGTRYEDVAVKGFKNPAIKLDNGDIVFGCECWWGAERAIKSNLKDRKIRTITVKEYREKAQRSVDEERE
tara:strand:+ start:184 stop:510 length:327 start_codon:yes stop_codon:yes gene_type:complete